MPSAVYALDPLLMGIAPAWALPLAIKRVGLTPDHIDMLGNPRGVQRASTGCHPRITQSRRRIRHPRREDHPQRGAVVAAFTNSAVDARWSTLETFRNTPRTIRDWLRVQTCQLSLLSPAPRERCLGAMVKRSPRTRNQSSAEFSIEQLRWSAVTCLSAG